MIAVAPLGERKRRGSYRLAGHNVVAHIPPSARAAARLAWSLGALALALTALSLLLLALNLSYPDTHFYAYCADCTVSAISFGAVGALIAALRPANPVGWLLCLGGVVLSIDHFSAQYAIYALFAQPSYAAQPFLS